MHTYSNMIKQTFFMAVSDINTNEQIPNTNQNPKQNHSAYITTIQTEASKEIQ